MKKFKFFIDMDSTITDSVKAYCTTYNIIYQDHSNFKPADHTKLSQYNLKCICPLVEKPLDMFEQTLLFEHLEFINNNTYEVLEKLSNKYELILVTIGTPSNLSQKSLWLEKNVPMIKNYVLLSNEGCKMNKSVVNMKGSIFVDDIVSNLESSNASIKVLFGKLFEWNLGWQGKHCFTWSDIEERFL